MVCVHLSYTLKIDENKKIVNTIYKFVAIADRNKLNIYLPPMVKFTFSGSSSSLKTFTRWNTLMGCVSSTLLKILIMGLAAVYFNITIYKI